MKNLVRTSILIIAASTAALSSTGLYAHQPLSFARGGSSAGGGITVGDISNPWFLANTNIATYCINIDTNNFDANAQQIRKAFSSAHRYWAKAFNEKPQQAFRVATQYFKEVSCEETPDVTIMAGHLTSEQVLLIPNQKSVIGYAQRVAYDRVQMKGRGFIYLAPVEGEKTPSIGLSPDFWSAYDGARLELALIHELGHVFGLRHSSGESGFFRAIMEEQFLEAMAWDSLNPTTGDPAFFKMLLEMYKNRSTLGDLGGKYSQRVCDHDENQYERWARLFEAPATGCISVEITDYYFLTATHTSEFGRQPRVLGKTIENHPYYWEMGWENLVTVYVPTEQQAFPQLPDDINPGDYWRGYQVRQPNVSASTTYEYDGGSRPLVITGTVDIDFGTMVDGKFTWYYTNMHAD